MFLPCPFYFLALQHGCCADFLFFSFGEGLRGERGIDRQIDLGKYTERDRELAIERDTEREGERESKRERERERGRETKWGEREIKRERER